MTLTAPSPDQQKVNMALEILKASGSVRFAARGYSMLPSLWPGDVLTIRAESCERMVEGDVILYAREGRLFAHRVLRHMVLSGQLALAVRGDSMPHEDRPVFASKVLGKVVAVERHGSSLHRVPRCTLLSRAAGLALCWNRLRSVVLRLYEARRPRLGVTSIEPNSI